MGNIATHSILDMEDAHPHDSSHRDILRHDILRYGRRLCNLRHVLHHLRDLHLHDLLHEHTLVK
jgi:hypothetical protein